MQITQVLRPMLEDVSVSGKFERNQVLAVLNILIDMAERLEKAERLLEIRHPG